MEDGQLNNLKVGFVIQARMGSTRLPNKVLMNIPLSGHRNLLDWIVDSVQESRFNSSVIVATSREKINDSIEEYCLKKKIHCYRGEEYDVFSRYAEVVKRYKFDVIIRLTGDNPIVDISLLDGVIEYHHKQNNEYTKTVGLPIGMNFEVLGPNVITRLEGESLTEEEKEHVTAFINHYPDKFRRSIYKVKQDIEGQEDLRLTIDYPSDYMVLSTILSLLDGDMPSLRHIIKCSHNYPWIFGVNKENFQKQTSLSEEEEFEAAEDLMRKHGFNNASKLILNYLNNEI